MNLEHMAMRWLWLEKKCHYVVEQRAPRFWLGTPDVLGVTQKRFLIEIEIKRTISDFRSDSKKRHRIHRDKFLDQQAKQFYYLVPRSISEKILPEIPEWAGLMCDCGNGMGCTVIKTAPVNAESQRLSVAECVRMCRYMVNHMMVAKANLETLKNCFVHGDSDSSVWAWDKSVGFYEI